MNRRMGGGEVGIWSILERTILQIFAILQLANMLHRHHLVRFPGNEWKAKCAGSDLTLIGSED